MALKSLFVIAAENTIHIITKDKRIQFTRDNEDFDEIKELLRNGDEEKLYERVMKGIFIVPEMSEGLFKVYGERIIDVETDTEVNMVIGKKIVEWSKAGLPFEPLLKFHRKVIKNPSKDSADDLFAFLEKNKIAITNDGNFIAYKKVKKNELGKLVDCHTGKVDNSVGKVVWMDRSKVDKDRRNECSSGYHVAGYGYMGSFSGDTILEVEVEPQDVVAVPMDYNRQKMRVCQYKILGISNGTERQSKFVKVNKKPVVENVKVTTIDKKTNKEVVKNQKKVVEGVVSATIEDVDFNEMTASKIKEYIHTNYGVNMTDDNKNKKGIVKKAYRIVSEHKK